MRSPSLNFFANYISGKRFNTFWGGVASIVTNESDVISYFANSSNYSTSDIKDFEINGENVAFRIETNYELSIGVNFVDKNMTYFVDLEGYCINNRASLQVNQNIFIYLPAITAIEDFALRRLGGAIMAFPNATSIGSTTGDDRVFESSTFGQLIIDSATTGDGDITELIGNGGSVLYKDTSNPNANTKPNAVTDLSATTIGGTYVELGFTQPTHVNTLKYALVFVNGFFQNITDVNKPYVIKLQQLTTYKVKIILADEYFNISDYSNTINVTTTTTPALFQNAVAYYKLEETSGNAIDVVNSYNGTLFGGVTQGVTGKIGNAYSFDGVDGRVDLPTSIYNDFDSNNFTLSFWAKANSNQTCNIIGQDVGSNFEELKTYIQFRNNNKIRAVFGDNGSVQDILSTLNYVVGNYYFIQIKYGIDFVLKINNQIQGVYTFTNKPSVNNAIVLGESGSTSLFLNGEIDEVSFINGQTTAQQDSDLYNNGNGTTI